MHTQNNTSFSIVVPVFNEEENVIPLIDNIFAAVGDDPRFLEVILVDDGSSDSTSSRINDLRLNEDKVRLVRHEDNRGLGAAICTGMNAAEGDLVLYTDADLPFDFSLIPGLLSRADEKSVVTGYRLNRGEGPRRWILTKGYNLLIWLFFGIYHRDVNFACKIFPRKFLNNAELSSAGSFIDVEMLLEARRLGLEIRACPLVYYPRERGLSTLSRPGVIFRILAEMYSYSAKQFSFQLAFAEPFNGSLLTRITVFLFTILVAAALMVEGVRFDQGTAWLALAAETGFASVIFGWRLGVFGAILPLLAIEFLLFWQGQPFLGRENYHLIAWSLFGIPLTQLGFGTWKLIQRSFGLTTSE